MTRTKMHGRFAILTLAMAISTSALLKPLIAQNSSGKQTQKSEDNPYERFKQCRVKALKTFSKPKQIARLKKELRSCKEASPQAIEYERCKKTSLKVHKKDISKARNAIEACREVMMAKTFQKKKELPLERVEDRLFFAGVDLNQEIQLGQLDKKLPGFDCTPLKEAMSGEGEPDFILFGNRMTSFSSELKGAAESLNASLKKLSWKKDKSQEQYKDIRGIGRFFGNDKGQSLFFPTSFCTYARPTGRFYEALKIYYLLNLKEKKLVPFFGLSFYRRSKDVSDEKEIISQLKLELAGEFREFATQRGAIYLVEDEIAEFDREDDPFDVCHLPRRHKIISVIKARKADDRSAMLMVVANIKNLCHFGDQRVLEWQQTQNKKKKKKKRP